MRLLPPTKKRSKAGADEGLARVRKKSRKLEANTAIIK